MGRRSGRSSAGTQRALAFSFRNFREILGERQDAEAAVFLRGIRTIGVCINNDDFVRSGAPKRRNKRVGRRVSMDVSFEYHRRLGAATCERLQLCAGLVADVQTRNTL